MTSRQYNRLIDFCMEGIDYFEKDDRIEVTKHRGGLYTAYIRGCGLQGFVKEAITGYERGMKDKRIPDLAKAAMCEAIVGAYYVNQDYENCIEVCKRYFGYYDALADNTELQYTQSTLYTEEAFFDEKYQNVCETYVRASLKIQDTKPLKQYYSACILNLDSDEDNPIKVSKRQPGRELIADMVDAMAMLPYEDMYVEVARYLAAEEATKTEFWKKVGTYIVGKDLQKEETLRMARVISQMEDSNLIYWSMKILYADAMNEVEELEQDFKELLTHAYNLFALEEGFFDIANKRRIELQSIVEEIPFKRIKMGIDAFCKKADLGEIDRRIAAIWKNSVLEGEEDSRCKYINIKRWEKVVIQVEENCSYEYLQHSMNEFSVRCVDFYRMYFKDIAFEGDMEALPSICCAAVRICGILQAEQNGETEKVVELLKLLMKEYTPFAPASKLYLQLFTGKSERLLNEQQQALTEMKILATQVKAKMYELLELGQLEGAKAIYNQLKTLIPNDPELIELEKQLAL